MPYHRWNTVGRDIYQCDKCGLYRCHALIDFVTNKPHKSGRKALVDIEYSTLRGDLIALNPSEYVPCEPGIYV